MLQSCPPPLKPLLHYGSLCARSFRDMIYFFWFILENNNPFQTCILGYLSLCVPGLRTRWIFVGVQVHKKFASPLSSSLSSIFRVQVRQKKTKYITFEFAALVKTKTKAVKPNAKTIKNGLMTGFNIMTGLKIYVTAKNIYIFFLFTIFIFYLRESELYCYVLDSMSALAWELLFPRCLGYLSFT